MPQQRLGWTEVKVKGKGRQHQPWRPPPPRRVVKRRRDDDDETADDSSQGSRRRKTFQSKSPPAPIEGLPTEILEPIIFMSQNLNFLRSSLRIGYRFSSASFLTELCITAFAPTWAMWFGYHQDEIHPDHAYLLDPTRVQGNPDFQSAVLACSWASTSILLEAQQRWYRRHGGPGRLWEYVVDHPEHRLGPPETPFRPTTDVTALFEKDWQDFKRRCVDFFSRTNPVDGAPIAGLRLTPARESLLDADFVELQPSTTIPKRLIVGPFNWETARILFWVSRGGGRLLHGHTWEMTWRGYDHITNLADPQLALVLALLLHRLRAFEHWPRFLIARGLQHASSQIRHSQRPAIQELGWGLSELLDPNSNYRLIPETAFFSG
ncbi:hypothetical protein C8A05DRAFT_17474 [Staphylotrichum tortipilum]|uniref:Uncharacterized protein n=1 Tax=Staphylotrichum tortipilum TaxID=2831512 RepID=A0AAN6RS62_9PEZI|nr:hypothetical protein C8A05DRAFT_17474 [Staphylotrichum longicolle]